ncbi:glutamate ligase domain-containing protein [Deinococcus sp. Marseille-Q6407]|uniref:glutamate ligase domain-containing protein n=1 Tax=Deinococcus sp. Marseille-Q6407 TaxID=2969223 RepID=UPI0021C06A7B|nr:cyanophycin synthetase [Deinococcus sp. Marseille-Q6407]
MTPDPTYDWLFSRTRAAAGRERGPQAARELLDRLGAPDRRFRSLRVVGTNGKGSTCAMLEAGLLAAGVRTGRFTSPHLHRFEERIRIAGEELAPARTREFVAWAQREAPEFAFFDLTLGLAAQTFAESGVEVAVMEAGVGGLSDATQALENVDAVLLTNVGLDHTAALGDSIAQIAADKAGAALSGAPLLSTAVGGEAQAAVQAAAERSGALLYLPETHPDLFALPHAPALAGAHQRQNAALALAALRLLGYDDGLEAALGASWPGRLERFGCQGRTVLLDGAHNPAAAQALAASLPRADTLLFGGFARKDTAQTVAPLLPLASQLVWTAPDEEGEVADPQALAARYGGEAQPNPRQALDRALALTPAGGTLLVTGSLYLVGLLRETLLQAGAGIQVG